jgi:hypothetical protein
LASLPAAGESELISFCFFQKARCEEAGRKNLIPRLPVDTKERGQRTHELESSTVPFIIIIIIIMTTTSSLLLAATVWLSLAVWPCQATFAANASSYLNVQIPTSLHQHGGGYQHRAAHFGTHWNLWEQEGSLVQPIRYAQGPLCALPNANVTEGFGQPPFVLLVDQGGGCTPVQKVRRAQQLGASAVLMANKHCLCKETNCTSDDPGECAHTLPQLNDDGSGRDVSIPSMILTKGKAEQIKKGLQNKETVVVELAWKVPKFEHNVTVDLWHTPIHTETQSFLSNFSALAEVLKDRLVFRPHYYLLDGEQLHCAGNAANPQDACYQLCTNNGRYCSVSHHGVTGRQVVVESLRRMCLWKHYPGKPWWEYLNHFAAWCGQSSGDYFSNPDCLKDAYHHSGVDQPTIDGCMKDSGDVDADQSNTLLTQAVADNSRVVQTPAVWINELPLSRTMTTKTVLEAFCFGFAHGMAPHVCYACARCGDPVACATRSPMKCLAQDTEDHENPKKETKKKKGGFFKFCLFVLVIGGCVVGGYKYYKTYMEDGDGMGRYSLGDALMSDAA